MPARQAQHQPEGYVMTITKEDLEKAVNEGIEKATKGLKEKNDELLGEIKKLKTDNKDLKEKYDATEDEKKRAEEEAANKSGDVEKIKKTLEEKHAKELTKKDEQIAANKKRLDQLLIDGGLSEELAKANVAPQYQDAVKALIKSGHKAEIAEDGDAVIAKINGKTIKEFISEWSQSDQGKHYVAAPANGGAGAGGSGGGVKDPIAQSRSKMNQVDKAAYIDKHGLESFNKLPA
jgi:signal recognition particle GTPase